MPGIGVAVGAGVGVGRGVGATDGAASAVQPAMTTASSATPARAERRPPDARVVVVAWLMIAALVGGRSPVAVWPACVDGRPENRHRRRPRLWPGEPPAGNGSTTARARDRRRTVHESDACPLISRRHDRGARRPATRLARPASIAGHPSGGDPLGTAIPRLSRPLGAIGGAVLILGGVLPAALVAPVAGGLDGGDQRVLGEHGGDRRRVRRDPRRAADEPLGLTRSSRSRATPAHGARSGRSTRSSRSAPPMPRAASSSTSPRTRSRTARSACSLVEDFTGALGRRPRHEQRRHVRRRRRGPRSSTASAVNDGGAGDRTYAVPSLGVAYDGQPFAPGGASRIPDGTDTDTAADWVRNDFDLAGIPGFTGTPVVGEALQHAGRRQRGGGGTAGDQRRRERRGCQRHDDVPVHGQPRHRRRPGRHVRHRDRGRNGDSAVRLHGERR